MKNKSPVILLTNFHSTLNAGDLALLEAALRQSRLAFHQPRMVVSANWPEEDYFRISDFSVVASPWKIIGASGSAPLPVQMVRLFQGLLLAKIAASGKPVDASPWQALYQAYREADLVLGVSGNQFYATGKYGWPFPVKAMSVELAHIFRKPFYIMPQTIGPLKRGWERAMLRSVYGRARGLFFREMTSVRLAQEIGILQEKCHYAPDPAFSHPPAERVEALSVLRRYGFQEDAPNIGATVIAQMGRSLDAVQVEEYYRSLADLFCWLSATLGARVYIFNQVLGPTAYDDDRAAVQKVLSMMGEASRQVSWVDESLSPAALKACYGMMGFFIASRLHSGIFALGMGVPTLLINYLSKTRAVMEAVGLGSWVIDLAEVGGNRLRDVVREAWNEREARARQLNQLLPGLIADADSVMEWIAKDYESG